MKFQIISMAVNEFISTAGIGIKKIEEKNNVKIKDDYLKYKNILSSEISNIAAYISGSYFYPEKYGMKVVEEEYDALILELNNCELYQSLFMYFLDDLKDLGYDKKKIACIAFMNYLQLTFWQLAKEQPKKISKIIKK